MFVDVKLYRLLIKKFRDREQNDNLKKKKIIKLVDKNGIRLIAAIRPSNTFW